MKYEYDFEMKNGAHLTITIDAAEDASREELTELVLDELKDGIKDAVFGLTNAQELAKLLYRASVLQNSRLGYSE